MERMLPLRTSSLAWTVPLLALVLAATLPVRAQAQFGPSPVLLRVVDQNGQELTGSVVRLVGTEQSWQTPATAMLDFGPQLVTIEPAFQGAMFPGGWVLPGAPNGLSRDEFLFVDGSPELVIQWQTAQVAINVVDQAQAPVSGGAWGFEGDGVFFAPGTVTAPITDENVYGSLLGPSRDGWRFAVRTAFDGQAIDLTRAEAREVDGATTGLSFEWRQSTCNMGVVDGTGAPIRGATWTMFGHTFAAGDAITLPTTDESLYPTLAGALAAGIPTSLFTNTPSGTGNATFEVNADGSLAPAFVAINGGSFGLRCGVDPFPPITTGTLDGTVLADGKSKPGVTVTLHDANGAARTTLSDAVGGFVFVDVPQGAATVEITVPAGFHTLEPKSGQIATTVVAGATTSVQFEIESDPPITTGTLDGTVLADGKSKPGVTVALHDANGATRTTLSDAVGGFVFVDVPQGAATVEITVPAGFHALEPKSGQIATTVVAGATTTVQFEIESDVAPPPVVNVPETANYWRREVRAALRGRGHHDESFADMSVNFPQAIFDQFANNADPVRVQGVTQVDPDGSGPLPARRLTLTDMDQTIDPLLASPLNDAKQQLLVILLNVVSGRLSLNLVVDAQGTTLAQEIRILAGMINDGKAANDRLARNHATRINAGLAVNARPRMSLTGDDLALGDAGSPDETLATPAVSALTATHAAGAGIQFAIALPAPGRVSLDVYDIAGRHVARLYEGDAPAGTTGVTWSRGSARPGVYFARLLAADGAHSIKVVAGN